MLPAWRETGYFNEKERAALTLTEAITLISTGQVPDIIYEQAAAKLSPEEISSIEWLAIVINTWNRIAISSRFLERWRCQQIQAALFDGDKFRGQ